MPQHTDSIRVARRFAVAFCVIALAAGGAGLVLDPAFAASHLSADGSLQPYTRTWLGIYRGVAFAVAVAAGLVATGLFVRADGAGAWFVARARPLRKCALAVVAAVMTLCILELALRAIDKRRPAAPVAHDFEAAARAFMAAVAPQLNADGFRDDSFDRPRADGEQRVLIIGDSFAFGFGVDDRGKTFPAALEAELSARAAVDVFNAGVPGADTQREAQVLASTVGRVAPDLVLIAWYVNDAESEAQKQEYVQQSRLVPLVSDALLRHSALWRRVEPALVSVCMSCGVKASYLDHLRSLYGAPSGAAWTQRDAFEALLANARADGRRVAVVLFPLVEDFVDYALLDVHSIVHDACDASHAPCLDLLDALKTEPAASLQTSAFDHHLNERGSARAARAIAEFIEREHLLERRASK